MVTFTPSTVSFYPHPTPRLLIEVCDSTYRRIPCNPHLFTHTHFAIPTAKRFLANR